MVVRVRIRSGMWADIPWIVVALASIGLAAGRLASLAAVGLVSEERYRSNVPLEPDGVHIFLAVLWYAYGWIAAPALGGSASRPRVVAPLVVGFLVQVFMGAFSYFVPALRGGPSSDRRRARGAVGRGWPVRVLVLNAGAVLLAVGRPGAGWVLIGAAVAWFAARVIRASAGGE
jgi:nitrite reductase (NO-forming)